MIVLLNLKWISLHFTYENLDADFTSWNNEFLHYTLWKSVGRFSYIKYEILYTSYMKIWGWFSYIKYGILYIVHMKILALFFLRYGAPMWYWSYLYFKNETMGTIVSSWSLEFFAFLTHMPRQFSATKYRILCIFLTDILLIFF